MQNICVLCNSTIDDKNDSKEHLIPNSIGGRRIVTGFICKKCNSNSGRDWDSELAKQLNPLCILFGITRGRGEPPAHTVTAANGEQFKLNPDGSMALEKPKCEIASNESGTTIDIHARSIQEANHMLAGLKRKYPELDADDVMKNAQSQSYCPEGMINLNLPSFGGDKAGRSIVKTCMALVAEEGMDVNSCKLAHDYLSKPDGTGGTVCWGFYYEPDLVVTRPDNMIFHCVSVYGNPQTKQLIGYVEYFSAWRSIVHLSEEYDGTGFSRTYSINPVSGDEIIIETDLSRLTSDDIAASLRRERMTYGSVRYAFEKAIAIAYQKSMRTELDRIMDDAFKKSGAKEG